jgi:GNAT superfamily N-acetyltransferase
VLVQLATSDAQILKCFATLSQLRLHLKQETFLDQIHRQQQDGYQLAFIEIDDCAIAVAGFHIAECLASGRFLYVYDLIVDESVRSQQYGQRLFDWLVAYAKSHNCNELNLDSGVQRFDAHRFYLRQRMNISAHHFSLPL